MLQPDNRELFVAGLKPPLGYRFDRGIGTTFTLNLTTLLAVPLSLALHEVSDLPEALHDPVVLLDCLQQYADRLSLFCQSGYVQIPSQHHPLFNRLENMVVEVDAPGGGVFHPKVWLLRYVSDDGPVLYRLLNMSRNLTFDRSWDVVMRLEGLVADRRRSYGRNRPLVDFVSQLPSLALRPASRRVGEDIRFLANEARIVDWHVPESFDGESLAFFPVGVEGYKHIPVPPEAWRTLVVSPFLTPGALRKLAAGDGGHVLISIPESIGSLPKRACDAFDDVFVLDDTAEPEPEVVSEGDSGGSGSAGAEPTGETAEEHRLSGLHAKIMVFEQGWDATWWLGSANATSAALEGHNVEFMVSLTGRKSKVGIDKVLGVESDDFSLRSMLLPYQPSETTDKNPDDLVAEELANDARRWVSSLRLTGKVTEVSENTCTVALRSDRKSASPRPPGVDIRVWPVSLTEGHSVDLKRLTRGRSIVLPEQSLVSLTSFLAVDIRAASGDAVHALRFVVNIPLKGIPKQREASVLASILADRSRFLRYLRLILAAEGEMVMPLASEVGAGGFWGSSGMESEALLEDLVRALSRSPEKINRISSVVDRLLANKNTRDVLPESFLNLWTQVRKVKGVK